jgi:hypothetical protein
MNAHLLSAIALAAAAGALASGAPSAGATSCGTGMHQTRVAGRPAFTFCGPASATVHLGGRTMRFSNGLCRVAAAAFSVNIGTLVPGLSSGKPPYFGITTHTAKPGPQLNAAVSFTVGGRGYPVVARSVLLAPGLDKGTFSGRVLGATTTVTGSFTC